VKVDCHRMALVLVSVIVLLALTTAWAGLAEAATAQVDWSLVAVPRPASARYAQLNGVSCASRTACVAVGAWSRVAYPDSWEMRPLVVGWDGLRWSIQRAAVPRGYAGFTFHGVSCSSVVSCNAVGFAQKMDGLGRSFVAHWGGSRWSIEQTPPTYELWGISCAFETCTAVGGGTSGLVAERSIGKHWSVQQTPFSEADLNGVSCPTLRFCAAVGSDELPDCSKGDIYLSVPVVGIWRHHRWSLKRQSRSDCADKADTSLEAVSCTAITTCTAVGDVIERWNGRRWMRQDTAVAGLDGVSCISAMTCVAVGYGLVMRSTGLTWSTVQTPRPSHALSWTLWSVSCTRRGWCTAAGSYISRGGETFPLIESSGLRPSFTG
jgi:hypothetical protein